jgi:ATP-dependent exoDNAse (exonuclease V) beta subunit
MKLEAIEVRKRIEPWLNRPLPQGRKTPWKIAVLVRNREHLSRIVAAFKQAPAIPFRSVDIEPLNEQPEILDLFALTRALLHPADRIAWFAVLRAPWCGLELAELHELIGGDLRISTPKTLMDCIQDRSQSLSRDSRERLARIWPVFRSALEQHSRLPLSEWIERTWRSLGGDASLHREQKNNARRYFELLDKLDQQGTFNLIQLQSRLKSLYAESLAAPGAVDLMTIHGAKGLEWDVVFVPGLERKGRNYRSRLLNWNEVSASDQLMPRVLLAPIAAKGGDAEALNRWLNRIQRTRELAEYKRLFYVASTRAREELHLFASPEQKQNGAILQNAGSLLHAAWPAAERHFVDVQMESKPLVVPKIPLRAPEENLVLPSLAVEGMETKTALLHRLPLSFIPSSRFSSIERLSSPLWPPSATVSFKRPEGSFEARAFGNAVHTFLELLAQQLAAGVTPHDLLHQISGWNTRISAVVRSHGLSPSTTEQLSIRVQDSLRSTLSDPVGRWILEKHPEALSEQALTSWQEGRSSVRLDRIFRSGSEPLSSGDDYLWIIDYKTTPYQGSNREEFFSHERKMYAPQLHAYLRTLRPDVASDRLRCGLYYPLLPGLTWWIPEAFSIVPEPHDDEHQPHEPRR